MIYGIKLEALEKTNELSKLALAGNDNFPDEICNYLVSEFELQATVLFKVQGTEIVVLGKSLSARKNYLNGTKFSCGICKIINDKLDFSVNSDTNCELQISEFVVYETCVLFDMGAGEKGFLKLAKKTPFAQGDSESLQKITDYIGFLLRAWGNVRGGSTNLASKPFSSLVAEIAAELRNPTNSIIGFTSILSEDNLSASQAEYVTTIKKNSQSLLLTINDLSELAKIESGKVADVKKQIGLNILVDEIATIFKNKFGNRINYTWNIDQNIPSEINIDDAKLRYILNNLLLFMTSLPQQNSILISVKPAGNKVLFTIDGKNNSLPSGSESTIFEPFVISKISELRASNLTGLGLTLVKRYVEILGGEIGAANITGGTSVKFSVLVGNKLSVSSGNKVESTISQLPKPTADNTKILVIEDDFATSKLLSNYLNKWGYSPTIVNKYDQILTLVEREQYLAIILDIELPNINGLELMRKIKEFHTNKSTPIIICSVEAEQQKAYMMGAVEYFVKPINYNYLVEVLTSYKLRKNSNILCVDDDLPTLNLVKQAIETAGFNSVAENVSANVMNLIKDKDIDLAIIDLDMPYPNGFELIKLIKTENKFARLPIIIYTGKENYQEDLKKIDGMFEFLLDKKSTNIEDLSGTISSMINRMDTPSTAEEVKQKKDEVKLLLAEDYKHSQIIVTRLLKKNNFENVVVVENGEEAYNAARKDKFDLILMDMQMPIMNGFEATEKIRQLPEYKDTPIIALTAFAMKGDREKCLDAGATDYIPKPIDSKEFIEKVKYYTNSSK